MPPPNPTPNPKLTPTILLLNLPPGILCGIDLLSFTTSARFRGIKDLPPGWHFIYTSETASLSIREGFWFEIPPITSTSTSPTSTSRRVATSTTSAPTSTSTATSTSASAPLLIRIWDPKLSILTPCPPSSSTYASYRAQLPSLWNQHLTSYRQSAYQEPSSGGGGGGDWALLTAHITPRLLTHLTGSEEEWIVTSASCAVQDRDEIPGLSGVEEEGEVELKGGGNVGQERTLGVLGIDLKRTWRPGAVGRERTEGAMDRGWALEDLVARWVRQRHGHHHHHHDKEEGSEEEGSEEEESEQEEDEEDEDAKKQQWGTPILGQMEVCFLMILTVANFSCLEEWKRILALVLTCKSIVKKREAWFASFLDLLTRQLAHGDDVEGGLFDMSDEAGGGGYLRELLRRFKRIVDEVFDDDGDNNNKIKEKINNDTNPNHNNKTPHPATPTLKPALSALESFLKAEYGWDDLNDSFLRRGMLELEDGEQVSELEMDDLLQEDERGEYAPVVVEGGDVGGDGDGEVGLLS